MDILNALWPFFGQYIGQCKTCILLVFSKDVPQYSNPRLPLLDLGLTDLQKKALGVHEEGCGCA